MTPLRTRRFAPALVLLACLPCCIPLVPVLWAAALGATGGWLATGNAGLALAALLAGGALAAALYLVGRHRHTAGAPTLVPLEGAVSRPGRE